MPAVSRMAGVVAADTRLFSLDLGALRHPTFVVHAGGGLLVLLAATALSVFKPWGMTRFGRRKRHEQKKMSQPMPPSGRSPAITPWRLFVLLGVIGLLVLFVVLHLTGWVPHGH